MIIFDKVENMEKNGYIKELKDIIDIFGFEYIKRKKKVINENINLIFYCQNEEKQEGEVKDDNEENNKIQSDVRELIESFERKYNTIIIKENSKNKNLNEHKKDSSKSFIYI